MTMTLNISLNVPESYGIEESTHQLTEYGERLISRSNRVQKSRERRSQTFLKGLTQPDESTDKELIEDMFGMPVPKERELRFVDIQAIAKFIDVGWEKTLY